VDELLVTVEKREELKDSINERLASEKRVQMVARSATNAMEELIKFIGSQHGRRH